MKTVIEMAREAGIEWDLFDEDEGQVWYITQAGLERFAELVRTDERRACERHFQVAIRNAVIAEREAMATEAAKQDWAMKNEDPFEDAVREIAAIRSRGNTC